MLGMINHAIEEMVTERLGAAAWERVKAAAGFADPIFVVMKPYPDELTFALVGAIAAETGMSVAEVLRDFGRFWVIYSDRQPWGKVMRSMGPDLRTLLLALDAMHARIEISFPGVTMPHFRVEEHGSTLRVHYFSPRAGLAPVVLGALEGLGAFYKEPVSVTQSADRAAGAAHDVFDVAFGGAK
jgi:hypothetical protein